MPLRRSSEKERGARLVFVGEQPGDHGDKSGHPFVGPAGHLLDKALAEAGIDRTDVYITNAVKHFKWEPQGKRRKHKRPSAAEMGACRPWLEAELALIPPQVLVCLGATAAQSVYQKAIRLKDLRGRFNPSPMAEQTFVTIHSSAIYRHPDAAEHAREYQRFVDDLRHLRQRLDELS